MRAPPWCLLRGKTRGSLRYSCRTRELIRQAERRARFQARRPACRKVRFRRTGCPRRAAPFFGAEGEAKQQNKRKRSVFSAPAPAACGSAPRRFLGRKARQNSRIGANVPFFRNGACGVRQRARAPAGAPRRFLMPPGFFIIMLKGAEGGKNVRGRQIFPFPPERKKFFKKSGKTESKTA